MWGVASMGRGEECRVINLNKIRRRRKYSLFFDLLNSFAIFFKIGKDETVKNHLPRKNHLTRPVNH